MKVYTAIAENHGVYRFDCYGVFGSLDEAIRVFSRESSMQRAHARSVFIHTIGTNIQEAKPVLVMQLSTKTVDVYACEGTSEHADEELRREMGLSS